MIVFLVGVYSLLKTLLENVLEKRKQKRKRKGEEPRSPANPAWPSSRAGALIPSLSFSFTDCWTPLLFSLTGGTHRNNASSSSVRNRDELSLSGRFQSQKQRDFPCLLRQSNPYKALVSCTTRLLLTVLNAHI